MKKILIIALALLGCMAAPPAHPSPQASQFGKSSVFETGGRDLAYDFSEHYAISKIAPAQKLILNSDELRLHQVDMVNTKPNYIWRDNNRNCYIISIMLNSATSAIIDSRLFGECSVSPRMGHIARTV